MNTTQSKTSSTSAPDSAAASDGSSGKKRNGKINILILRYRPAHSGSQKISLKENERKAVNGLRRRISRRLKVNEIHGSHQCKFLSLRICDDDSAFREESERAGNDCFVVVPVDYINGNRTMSPFWPGHESHCRQVAPLAKKGVHIAPRNVQGRNKVDCIARQIVELVLAHSDVQPKRVDPKKPTVPSREKPVSIQPVLPQGPFRRIFKAEQS